ncbi:hypothetical protein [Nitrosomonas supralitoralis]|uniref:Uncharacterized protein n=1 Tax=Nitrosomonas supralitoralis TaxID=2116706 RepID=A0A2P7NTV1_9PROT|nr:hypothetical protein [Nitrosomonas supralitoralis]PSJ16896.1 hypothetical protein C7H79_11070 [Nitrosomonas supralitoralis]
MSEQGRAPTVKQACDFIDICHDPEYKELCIKKWGEWFGDNLEIAIRRELEARKNTKGKK